MTRSAVLAETAPLPPASRRPLAAGGRCRLAGRPARGGAVRLASGAAAPGHRAAGAAGCAGRGPAARWRRGALARPLRRCGACARPRPVRRRRHPPGLGSEPPAAAADAGRARRRCAARRLGRRQPALPRPRLGLRAGSGAARAAPVPVRGAARRRPRAARAAGRACTAHRRHARLCGRAGQQPRRQRSRRAVRAGPGAGRWRHGAARRARPGAGGGAAGRGGWRLRAGLARRITGCCSTRSRSPSGSAAAMAPPPSPRRLPTARAPRRSGCIAWHRRAARCRALAPATIPRWPTCPAAARRMRAAASNAPRGCSAAPAPGIATTSAAARWASPCPGATLPRGGPWRSEGWRGETRGALSVLLRTGAPLRFRPAQADLLHLDLSARRDRAAARWRHRRLQPAAGLRLVGAMRCPAPPATTPSCSTGRSRCRASRASCSRAGRPAARCPMAPRCATGAGGAHQRRVTLARRPPDRRGPRRRPLRRAHAALAPGAGRLAADRGRRRGRRSAHRHRRRCAAPPAPGAGLGEPRLWRGGAGAGAARSRPARRSRASTTVLEVP